MEVQDISDLAEYQDVLMGNLAQTIDEMMEEICCIKQRIESNKIYHATDDLFIVAVKTLLNNSLLEIDREHRAIMGFVKNLS